MRRPAVEPAIVSQMLTLFTTPVIFISMDVLGERIARLLHALAMPTAPPPPPGE